MKGKGTLKLERLYALILSAGGTTGLIAMAWQASERVHMLKNPDLALGCNLSPIVNCSGVLGDRLAAVMGFPNAFLGMVFFSILATSGLVLLSGGRFLGWYRHFVMAVSLVLILFSVWFFGVSLYVLGKICIFCVVGWVVIVPIFWYGLLYYLQSATGRFKQSTLQFTKFGRKHHVDVVVFVYAVMIVLFILRFKDYYFN